MSSMLVHGLSDRSMVPRIIVRVKVCEHVHSCVDRKLDERINDIRRLRVHAVEGVGANQATRGGVGHQRCEGTQTLEGVNTTFPNIEHWDGSTPGHTRKRAERVREEESARSTLVASRVVRSGRLSLCDALLRARCH